MYSNNFTKTTDNERKAGQLARPRRIVLRIFSKEYTAVDEPMKHNVKIEFYLSYLPSISHLFVCKKKKKKQKR